MSRKKIFFWCLPILVLLGLFFVLWANNHVVRTARPLIGAFGQENGSNQAIIVLGAYVRPNGTLSPMLRDRLDKGYELYQSKIAPKILVTGDHGRKTYNEVQAMKDYLVAKGVPESDVFMDHAGFDTYDSLYRARDVFKVKKALVVSQDFHIARAVYIANGIGLAARGEIAGPPNPWWFKAVMREWLARVKAVWDVEIYKPSPKFLGPALSIEGDGRITQD